MDLTSKAAIAGLLVWLWGVGSLSLVMARSLCKLWQTLKEARQMRSKRGRWVQWVAMLLILLVAIWGALVWSTEVVSAQQPVKPFSRASNYMSAAGLARYLHHVQTGQW